MNFQLRVKKNFAVSVSLHTSLNSVKGFKMVRVEQESYDYRYSMEIVPNIQAQFQIAGNNISHQVNNKPTDQSNVQ